MSNHGGKCECGGVTVSLSLPASLDQYKPRQCDCDFCTSRNISYISHPHGELQIESANSLESLKQGSNQASFITCGNCKTVIAASINLDNKILGSLNAQLLDNFSILQKPVIVSPQILSAKEKVSRWQSNWGNIKIIGENRI